ncbi:MAG: DUF1858 domain-containing protein [Clostridia bacterium]
MAQATKDMTIQKLIELNQATAEVLMNAGMHCLGCIMAHGETIEQACAVHGIDVDKLMQEINMVLAD